MRILMITFAAAFASNMLASAQDVLAQPGPSAPASAATRPGPASVAPAPLAAETINATRLDAIPLAPTDPAPTAAATGPEPADPFIVRLQILLDRAGASPGVIDGIYGDNVRKAVVALEAMLGLPPDGELDDALLATLEPGGPVIGSYSITPADVDAVVAPLPTDYAELATRDFLGYESVAEAVAERFHMDVDLLASLNPEADYRAGETVLVAAYGPDRTGRIARIEADKRLRQVRGYDQAGRLLVAYPATIGSADNPSPSGRHEVLGVAPMPDYTYDPEVNFQQGDNDQVLVLPPGPNGPVGTVWIDLSEPSFGIHGTPEPAQIDKTASHGCVRLTNWDAAELAAMVRPGVIVEFLD